MPCNDGRDAVDRLIAFEVCERDVEETAISELRDDRETLRIVELIERRIGIGRRGRTGRAPIDRAVLVVDVLDEVLANGRAVEVRVLIQPDVSSVEVRADADFFGADLLGDGRCDERDFGDVDRAGHHLTATGHDLNGLLDLNEDRARTRGRCAVDGSRAFDVDVATGLHFSAAATGERADDQHVADAEISNANDSEELLVGPIAADARVDFERVRRSDVAVDRCVADRVDEHSTGNRRSEDVARDRDALALQVDAVERLDRCGFMTRLTGGSDEVIGRSQINLRARAARLEHGVLTDADVRRVEANEGVRFDSTEHRDMRGLRHCDGLRIDDQRTIERTRLTDIAAQCERLIACESDAAAVAGCQYAAAEPHGFVGRAERFSVRVDFVAEFVGHHDQRIDHQADSGLVRPAGHAELICRANDAVDEH